MQDHFHQLLTLVNYGSIWMAMSQSLIASIGIPICKNTWAPIETTFKLRIHCMNKFNRVSISTTTTLSPQTKTEVVFEHE